MMLHTAQLLHNSSRDLYDGTQVPYDYKQALHDTQVVHDATKLL